MEIGLKYVDFALKKFGRFEARNCQFKSLRELDCYRAVVGKFTITRVHFVKKTSPGINATTHPGQSERNFVLFVM